MPGTDFFIKINQRTTGAAMDTTMNKEYFYVHDGKRTVGKRPFISRVIEGRHAALKIATDGIELSVDAKRRAVDFLEGRFDDFSVVRRTRRAIGDFTHYVRTTSVIELVVIG